MFIVNNKDTRTTPLAKSFFEIYFKYLLFIYKLFDGELINETFLEGPKVF